jgi:hypothetical protein
MTAFIKNVIVFFPLNFLIKNTSLKHVLIFLNLIFKGTLNGIESISKVQELDFD